MPLKQILTFDVNSILRWDVNRILLWGVGRAVMRPVRNPLLRFACGYLGGIMMFGLGSIVVGIRPSDAAIKLLAIALGVTFAIVPERVFTRGGVSIKPGTPAF